MKNIIEHYKDGDVSVRTDSIGGTTFITTEIPTHDGKFLILGASNYISETWDEAEFEMWLCDRSYINDDLITDIKCSCYDKFDCCDFVNSDDPEKELKNLAGTETLHYFDELKIAVHSLIGAMEKYFDLSDEEELPEIETEM